MGLPFLALRLPVEIFMSLIICLQAGTVEGVALSRLKELLGNSWAQNSKERLNMISVHGSLTEIHTLLTTGAGDV